MDWAKLGTRKELSRALLFLLLLFFESPMVNAEELCASAYQLYRQGAYAQAADAFEKCLQGHQPDANLCYYAALANRQARREVRAQQLFTHLARHFPGTPQAAYANKALATHLSASPSPQNTAVVSNSTAASTAVAELDIPEVVKARLSPEERAALKTPIGQDAIKSVLQQQSEQAAEEKRANQIAEAASVRERGDFLPYIDIAEHTAYSDSIRNKIAEAIRLLPPGPRSIILSSGCRVLIVPNNADFEQDPGFDTLGMFLPTKNKIEIAEKTSGRVNRYFKILIFHECGHAFDNGLSQSPIYLSLYMEEANKLSTSEQQELDYYLSGSKGPVECFAQLFSIVCADQHHVRDEMPPHRDLMCKKFPKTLEFVRAAMSSQ